MTLTPTRPQPQPTQLPGVPHLLGQSTKRGGRVLFSLERGIPYIRYGNVHIKSLKSVNRMSYASSIEREIWVAKLWVMGARGSDSRKNRLECLEAAEARLKYAELYLNHYTKRRVR